MRETIEHTEQILNNSISGFHQYQLAEPARLRYVSQNLCDMLGIPREEFHEEGRDLYALLVHPADRKSYLDFLKLLSGGVQTRSLQYRILKKDGSLLHVKDTVTVRQEGGGGLVGDSVLTDITMLQTGEADFLKQENASLKAINENMKELVRHFTDGIAAFEVNGALVTPLYASENVCNFFGFAQEEWFSLMKKQTSIKTFVAQSGLDYEGVAELLKNGKAEFTYYDLNRHEERRIKAVCSEVSKDGFSPRYIMLYHEDQKQLPNAGRQKLRTVTIRTFGYFDVFVEGKPIAFRNQKAKELFALLVDRRGGYVTSEEAISFLWEEEPLNAVTLSRYRKVALRLKNNLEEYGIADVIESEGGKRRIVAEKVQCDLYDYLSGKEEYARLFKGSYLSNYSWGETTLGELAGEFS